MDIKKKSFLVTGGAGFIGSAIVDLLLKEDIKEVIAYDNLCRGKIENLDQALKDKRCKFIKGDILDTDLLDKTISKVDGVFHLAAASLLDCYENPELAFEVNIRGTFNVIKPLLKKPKKIVFSSSASVYGNALSIPMTEDHPYNNETFYGAAKISGEHMLKSLGAQYGFEWIGLRYMNVYGLRQDQRGAYTSVIFKILDKLDIGEKPVIFGDGSQEYDFIYVDDVAYANILAMKSSHSGGFYNIGTGLGTTIKKLTRLMLKLMNSKMGIQYEKAGLTFVTKRIGSIKKARTDFKFKYSVDLESGLKKIISNRNK